jgi:hypothetical protein
LPYETNKNQKLLLETVKTGLSDFVETNGSQGHHWASTRWSSFGQVTSGQ